MIPRWGLLDPAILQPVAATAPDRPGPSPGALRATLVITSAALAVAALLHLVRYVLLIVNRDTLLNPFVAGAATWLAVVASVAVMFSVVGCAFVLTEWLIARRAAAFAHRHQPDPRRVGTLRAGCLIPLLNLLLAPVFVIELAEAAERYRRLRRLIIAWWLLFLASTFVSAFATATSFTTDPQGIGDNHVSFIVAYLVALAAVIAVGRVVRDYDRVPVERPAHRWVVVRDQDDAGEDARGPVEQEGQKAAALAV